MVKKEGRSAQGAMMGAGQTAAAGEPKQRGRPAVARPFYPLIVELQRLTGCGDRALSLAFARLARSEKSTDKPRIPKLSESTIQLALTETTVAANRPRPPFPRPPGWCALHVVPVRLDGGETWDLALLWEPFSMVLLGEIETTFADNRATGRASDRTLANFVNDSLKRLPATLTGALTAIRHTCPKPAADFGHWYSDAASLGALRPIPPGRRYSALQSVADDPTENYAPFDIRPMLAGRRINEARLQLALALNAHNLKVERERKPATLELKDRRRNDAFRRAPEAALARFGPANDVRRDLTYRALPPPKSQTSS